MLLLDINRTARKQSDRAPSSAWMDVSAKRPGLWFYDAEGTLRRATQEEVEALTEAFPDYF